jgi:hypothetical protein
MTLDAVTEKIAHFIGAFEMLVEQNRLRQDYDEFRAARAVEDAAGKLDLGSIGVKHSFALEDYTAKLAYPVSPVAMPRPDPGPQDQSAPRAVPTEQPPTPLGEAAAPTAALLMPGAAMPPADLDTVSVAPTPTPTPSFTLSVASSVATVTIQTNSLHDDDSFGDTESVAMQSVAPLHVALDVLETAAATVNPISSTLNPTTADWAPDTAAMVAAAKSMSEIDDPAFSVSVATGSEAINTLYVDGVAAKEAPIFEDLLPAYAQAKAEAAVVTVTTADFGLDGVTTDAGTADGPDGSFAVTGANTLVNAATINSVWLDAPVIVAAGNVVRFDGIAQVNLLVEHDAVAPSLTIAALADSASTAMNVAGINQTSSQAAGPATKSAEFTLNPPANWVVAHVDGPVTQMNWVHQYNFATDFDQAVITQGGTTLQLGMGENTLGNSFDVFELGFRYDLIIVNGDVIDVNIVTQTNVLLDSDIVTEGALPHANATTPVAANGGAAVAGTATTAAAVSGIDPLPASEPAVGTPTLPQDPTAPPPVSTADNLLYNEAIISTIGADTDTEITETFQNAIADLTSGSETLAGDIAPNAHFDGIELLRVLYIDGDFTTVNYISQTNILGDSDQVHLLRDDFAAQLQAEIEVTTGSNILANVAEIRDTGVDSTVMAQGTTYSDALIYQANLIDDDTAPLGARISDLTNEAVAFLTDDIIGPDLAGDIAALVHTDDIPGSSDIMQSMLA